MRVAYHEYPVEKWPMTNTARSVMEAEEIRQQAECACRLFVSPDGTEVMLVADCDGQEAEAVLEFANDNADKPGVFVLP
jgi:hypothetical protein